MAPENIAHLRPVPPTSCGKHWPLWIGMAGSVMATSVIVGMFVGGMREDINALKDRIDQTYQQNQMLTASLATLTTAVAKLEGSVEMTHSLLDQERQDRINDERRMFGEAHRR